MSFSVVPQRHFTFQYFVRQYSNLDKYPYIYKKGSSKFRRKLKRGGMSPPHYANLAQLESKLPEQFVEQTVLIVQIAVFHAVREQIVQFLKGLLFRRVVLNF